MQQYLNLALLSSILLHSALSTPLGMRAFTNPDASSTNNVFQTSENAINVCLMACAMCFDDSKQDAALMMCANQVCLKSLKEGSTLNRYFSKRCPGLKMAWSRAM